MRDHDFTEYLMSDEAAEEERTRRRMRHLYEHRDPQTPRHPHLDWPWLILATAAIAAVILWGVWLP